jgi:DNA-binding transcriptional MerR regulator
VCASGCAGQGRRLVGLGSRVAVWYDSGMTRDQVKEILDRVLTWPAERQADLAHMVEMMEAQDRSTLHLTDEQLAEVRRRRAEKNPKTITLAELNARLRQRYGV